MPRAKTPMMCLPIESCDLKLSLPFTAVPQYRHLFSRSRGDRLWGEGGSLSKLSIPPWRKRWKHAGLQAAPNLDCPNSRITQLIKREHTGMYGCTSSLTRQNSCCVGLSLDSRKEAASTPRCQTAL